MRQAKRAAQAAEKQALSASTSAEAARAAAAEAAEESRAKLRQYFGQLAGSSLRIAKLHAEKLDWPRVAESLHFVAEGQMAYQEPSPNTELITLRNEITEWTVELGPKQSQAKMVGSQLTAWKGFLNRLSLVSFSVSTSPIADDQIGENNNV